MSELLKRIKINAGLFPQRIMYHYINADEDIVELTWEEIDVLSDYVAKIIEMKCDNKTPVVVYGHKHPLMVVSFLGCVKSGRAYCPIDISVPEDRVGSIVNSIDPELIINLSSYSIEAFANRMVFTDKDLTLKEDVADNKPTEIKDDEVFYIIYTSGSTGNPKGVQITSACLDNFLKWASTLATDIESRDSNVFLNSAPFSFDLSVMDLYLALYTGGTLWTMDKALLHDIRNVTTLLSPSKVNVAVATPSYINMCFADKNFNADNITELKTFLFCGETLPTKLVKRIKERFPDSEIVNTYGPTESTCAVTGVTISDEIMDRYDPLPIGYPKEGTWIAIVNNNGQEVEPGQKGEIIITGDSVSLGYYKQNELTDEKFGKKKIDRVEYRYYRTGDAGFVKDGLLFYDGRIDLQIKLNGYRIEIEDIENNMIKIDEVEDVIVIPNFKDGESEVRSLSAYVLLEKTGNSIPDISGYIKKKAEKYLPSYMIPKKIKIVDSLPLTSNGKKDRKKARIIWQ